MPSFGQGKSNWAKPMRMLTVNCGQNSVLGAFHFEFSEGGKWGRVRYQCCKAGGAPVTFDPRGQARVEDCGIKISSCLKRIIFEDQIC